MFSELIPTLVANQYKNSPLLIAYFQALAVEMDDLEAQALAVIQKRYFEGAEGIQLDIIGNIIGITREVVDFTQFIYFGFDPDPTAKTYDDGGLDLAQAGRFRSTEEAGDVTKLLSDGEFKAVLAAKILKNTSDITPNEVIVITREILKVMFIQGDVIEVTIQELGNAAFNIVIGAELDGAQQAFIASLDLIPRPAGVRIGYVYEAPSTDLLGGDGLTLFTQSNENILIQ